MQFTLKSKLADDPHDVVAVTPDAVRVVPAVEELSNLLREAARHHAAPHAQPHAHAAPNLAASPPVPPVDTTFRATAVNDVQDHFHLARSPRSIGNRLARAFTALLLATCVGVFGIVWRGYGDATIQMITKSAPQFLTSLLPSEKPTPSAEPAAATVVADAAQTDASNAAPTQPATPPQAAPDNVAPAAAAPPPEQGQLLQSMARDLAGLGQQVEQLKASIEELKAGQQQMSRDMAKASEQKVSEQKASEQNRAAEQSARPRMSAISPPPPRPAVARPRKPVSPLPPPQAAIAPPLPPAAAAPYVPPPATAPYAPRQSDYVPPPTQGTAEPPDEASSSTPRPPMPVR